MENVNDVFALAKLWRLCVAGIGLLLLMLVPIAMHYLTKLLDWRIAKGKFAAVRKMESDPLALADYYGKRWIGSSIVAAAALISLALLLTGCTPARAGELVPAKYEATVKRAVDLYWIDYPFWAAWGAQIYQESRFDCDAISAAGAVGCVQMMSGTWRDVSRALAFGTIPRTMAEPAILGGAWYMAQLRKQWRAHERPPDERQLLAQASYNAGTGSILRAQELCGGIMWTEIAPCLADVTGERNARETIGYPIAIAKWRALIEAKL